jgi:regulator of replication initiation timing
MSEQADIEAALARATAAYKNLRAERDALKDAAYRAAAAEAMSDLDVFMAINASLTNEVLELRAERDRLREALDAAVEDYNDALAENDRLREALEKIAELNWLDDPHEARRIARAALAKEEGQ